MLYILFFFPRDLIGNYIRGLYRRVLCYITCPTWSVAFELSCKRILFLFLMVFAFTAAFLLKYYKTLLIMSPLVISGRYASLLRCIWYYNSVCFSKRIVDTIIEATIHSFLFSKLNHQISIVGQIIFVLHFHSFRLMTGRIQ